MKCVIEFFSDKYQKDLRRLAQVQCEGYENCIEQYKKLFIVNFLEISSECKCTDKEINNYLCKDCDEFKGIINTITKEEIEEFFNKLKSIYINWIDAKPDKSINDFRSLLKDYDILDIKAEDIERDVLFKGRKEKNILTKWDMFHIPFNKRYLIGNQRYSLTGQPIIYLGKSIIDVVEELGINNEEELKVSSFRINKDLKIYDLRNNIFNDITKRDVSQLLGEHTPIYSKKKFFKSILSSVCSFERRREHKKYSFCEEYVIPQILAQIVKNEGFDGIIYYSTKKFTNIKFDNEENKYKYKENIALFTNFDNEHVYDRKLYDQLRISVPIDIYKIEHISFNDLREIYNKIGNTGIIDISTRSDILISSFEREYSNMKICEEKYIDTYMGKLHMYHIYCILNEMLCEAIEE